MYHPDESKQGQFVESTLFPSFTTKDMKSMTQAPHRGFADSKSLKKTFKTSIRFDNDEMDIAPPKKKRQESESTRRKAKKISMPEVSNQRREREDKFEQYLIKEKERSSTSSNSNTRYDTSSSLQEITASKDGLHHLLSNEEEIEKVVDKVPEVTCFSNSPSNTDIVADASHESHACLYKQNPMTGKFYRRGACLAKPSQIKVNNHDEKIERFHYLIQLISMLSNVVYVFTSGILAGFSIHSIHQFSTLSSSGITSSFQHHDYGAGMVKFYVVAISLCSTGVIVKRNALISGNGWIPKIAFFLLCSHTIAQVLTLSIAKNELNLQYGSEKNPTLAQNQISLWKNLTIIRSTLCIIQWLMVSCWEATSNTSM